VPFRPFFEESADDEELLSFLRPFALVAAWSNLPLLELRLAKLGIPSVRASPLPPPGVHASDHLYASLGPLGIDGAAPPPAIVPGVESRAAARDFLTRYGIGELSFVALHPSSGSRRKNWPKEKFLELAARLREDRWPVLWIEGEADRDVVSFLGSRIEAPVARELPLPVLAALLSLSRGFVGNDSGVSHLSAAVGARTIALFGPTDPANWCPRGPFVHVASFGADADEVWGKARSMFRPR
jgi:ADP-heptose:LPS heptosyltransferase